MKKRTHRPTSKAGESHILPHKESHKEKIMKAIKQAKVGATQEEAAALAGLRPDQVWKRLSELEEAGKIFNTGITRKLKSGVQGIVWQIKGLKPSAEVPVLPNKNSKKKEAQNFMNDLLEGKLDSKQQIQKPLFL